MDLANKKRIAAQVMKCGQHKVRFDENSLKAIKEAITKSDIRALVKDGVISERRFKGISHGKLRENLKQRRKGRRTGPGKKKGTHTARLPRKSEWIIKIRAIRDLLRTLREKKVIPPSTYRMLYKKSKGGFFRSRRHVKLYIEEHALTKKK